MHKLKGVVSHLAHNISSPRFHGVIPISHQLLVRPYSSTNSDSARLLELKAQAKAWNMMFTFINSMSLSCAVQLGVADAIHRHGGAMSAAQLAAALPIHPSKAHYVPRLMRLLIHSGLFARDKGGYALTDASRLLLSDNPHGVSSFVGFVLSPDIMKPWLHLAQWFQSEDATTFVTGHDVEFWDFGRTNTEIFRVFGDAMARDSRLVARMLVEKAEFRKVFEGVGSLVDVGGGTGTMAKAVAAEFRAMECVVFDLPHVVAGLEGSRNLKFVGGSMLEAIPPGEAILFKMMVLVDGRERSEKEWSKLFSDAGFNSYKITHGLGIRSIIEVYP